MRLLYTEMIVSTALLRGDARRLLEHSAAEHPVALQLGGCDPKELAAAARIGAAAGFAEINLNVGCPSDRVKNGSFGACLMLRPALVADCVRALSDATPLPVTVKCRIGIDDRDDYEFFAAFVDAVAGAGIAALIVHARAAILGGLSPKENREIPPLKYDYVHRLKRERPELTLVLNGGLSQVAEIHGHVAAGLDGVMIGRAAYHRPALLAELEQALDRPGLARAGAPGDHRARGFLRQGLRAAGYTPALDHPAHARLDGRDARARAPGAGFCPRWPHAPMRCPKRSIRRFRY